MFPIVIMCSGCIEYSPSKYLNKYLKNYQAAYFTIVPRAVYLNILAVEFFPNLELLETN